MWFMCVVDWMNHLLLLHHIYLWKACIENVHEISVFQDIFCNFKIISIFFLFFFQFFKMVSNFSRLLPILQQKIHSILLWDSLEWLENLLKEQKEPIMTNLSGSCSIFQEGLIMCFMFVVDQMNNLLLTHYIYLWKACIKTIYIISVFQDIFCNLQMVSIFFIIVSNFSRRFPIFQDSFQFFKIVSNFSRLGRLHFAPGPVGGPINRLA